MHVGTSVGHDGAPHTGSFTRDTDRNVNVATVGPPPPFTLPFYPFAVVFPNTAPVYRCRAVIPRIIGPKYTTPPWHSDSPQSSIACNGVVVPRAFGPPFPWCYVVARHAHLYFSVCTDTRASCVDDSSRWQGAGSCRRVFDLFAGPDSIFALSLGSGDQSYSVQSGQSRSRYM